MDCNEIAQEELKRLRDIQRLLQFLAKKVGGNSVLLSIGLDEVL